MAEKSQLMAYITGIIARLNAVAKPREPIAYLYNGIRLPALPEWDRGVYPYAAINDYTNGYGKRYVTLYVFTEQYTISADSDSYAHSNFMKPLCSFSYDSENDQWGELDNWDDSHPNNSGVQCDVGDVIWTNFDWTVGWVNPYQTITKYKVGDIVLAASDPVPVYE